MPKPSTPGHLASTKYAPTPLVRVTLALRRVIFDRRLRIEARVAGGAAARQGRQDIAKNPSIVDKLGKHSNGEVTSHWYPDHDVVTCYLLVAEA